MGIYWLKERKVYTTTNFRTKKGLKEAVKKGDRITIFQPGPFNTGEVQDGWHAVEGPHYPEPHKWYARVRVENGEVKEVK